MTSCQHKRKFVTVNRMHLTIIDNNPHVSCITSSQRTMFHTIHHTFQNGWHEAGINSTTNNRIDEYQFTTPFQVDNFLAFDVHFELLSIEIIVSRIKHTLCIWLYYQMHFTKLPGTATLFLMPILCLCFLGNSLTIWNSRLTKLYLQLLIVFKTPLQRSQMEFSLPVNNNLSQLLRIDSFYSSAVF